MKTPLKAILDYKGREVHTVAPATCVADAVRTMNAHSIGAVLVMDGDRTVGVFTERDVLRRVVDGARNAQTTAVGEVMTREVVAVHETTTVEEAKAVITQKRCRHLPILDGDKVVGIVSAGDLTRWTVRYREFDVQQLVDYIAGRYPG